MIEDLTQVPPHELDPAFYRDWGDAREYTVGDLGHGECAGEVVSPVEFQLAACEREVFEAQLLLEKNDPHAAAALAYASMAHGALALLQQKGQGLPTDPESVVARFRRVFYDTQLFFDPFVGGKFAHYFFDANARAAAQYDLEGAHRLVEEAQLFIEACHACYARLLQEPALAESTK
jgi:sulfite reductase (ferredoxin)